MSSIELSGLAKRLIADEVLDEATAVSVTKAAKRESQSFAQHVVTAKLVGSHQLAMIAAEAFGSPLFDLGAYDFDLIPQGLVDEKLIGKHFALPLYKRGNRLFVAVADPTNLAGLDEINFNTGLSTDAILVESDKLTLAIEKYLSGSGGLEDGLNEIEDNLDELNDNPEASPTEDDPDEAPVVRFVHKVLLNAIRTNASDIHFEPYEKSYRVRLRTDGILHEVARPPIQLAIRISSRLKVMAQMDISERRVPQDGRIKMRLSKLRAIEFRVSSLPTLWGEKIVLRILDPSSAKLGIDALGYEEDQKELYLDALAKPQGMILVTGPTGSGKTVSLYTGLNILNTPERNISTAEDPVEINLEGVNQVNIHPRVGLNFAEALRSFLRQDPDIVMVGEIRDLETAEIAIKASQTGHLVLSTLHTNSAPETLTRLMNMGVPSFNIATSVSIIIAQRLARKLCGECKKPADLPAEVLEAEGFERVNIHSAKWRIFQPEGCAHCTNGYKGRTGVYEVVRITDGLSNLIMSGANSIQLADQAQKEGFTNLRISALRKVVMGITSLEEANRITKD